VSVRLKRVGNKRFFPPEVLSYNWRDFMSNLKVIDLSWKYTNDIKLYPGAEPISIRTSTNPSKGDPVLLTTVDGFCAHFGTHVDCPAHMVSGGFRCDEKPAEFYIGEGTVIDCSAYKEGSKIGLEVIENIDLSGKDFVLFYIGWAKKFGTDEQYQDYPILSIELADFLGKDSTIRGIGIETNNVDRTGDESYPNHRALLSRNDKVIYEALTNLEQLIGKDFLFIGFPLNINKAEAGLVRAAALVKE
jgi:kynurenine formamidase